VSIVITPAKVVRTPRGIGTAGARLSDTDSGRAASMKRHPAGKKRELTVLQGLQRPVIRDLDVAIFELEQWFDEYDEVRADLESKRKIREAESAKRRAEHLSLVADWK